MAFDTDDSKVGTEVGGVPVYHVNELEDKISGIEVAILTIPAEEADAAANRLVELGIKGILNFTPARITVPNYIRVHHIDLTVELQSLVYFLKHYSLEEE